jgi:phi13 family phage major tail protein
MEMSTIGLDKLYYAPITEAQDTGEETYGTPVMLARAITAQLTIELAESILYADDSAAEIVKEFKSGKLTLGVDNIGRSAAAALVGAATDDNGVLISASEDGGAPVAIGFRAQKANGSYRYFWLFRVKFGVPSTNLTTKGDSITFSTPTIEGTVSRRNKESGSGSHPWKAEVDADDTGVAASVINGWYTQVYEPTFAASGS